MPINIWACGGFTSHGSVACAQAPERSPVTPAYYISKCARAGSPMWLPRSTLLAPVQYEP